MSIEQNNFIKKKYEYIREIDFYASVACGDNYLPHVQNA